MECILSLQGTFFSIGNKYIYTFSVALFFCISGFLCKKEEDHRFFWKKLWYNLIIPMILICTISFAWKTQSEIRHNIFNCENLYMFPILLISGFHKVLGPMWFVYTLCILKIVFQFLPSKWLYTLAFFHLLSRLRQTNAFITHLSQQHLWESMRMP